MTAAFPPRYQLVMRTQENNDKEKIVIDFTG
jgi:CRISPR/Cas system-associated protein Csx1